MEREVFGRFIADRRRALGLTQQALADQLHVTDKAVSKWERGLCYPDLTLLESLADALHITVAQLMACETDTPPQEQNMHTLLDIAEESRYRQKRQMRFSFFCSTCILCLLIGFAAVWLCCNHNESGPFSFLGKKEDDGAYFLYCQIHGSLVQLYCADTQLYESVTADSQQRYQASFRWNSLTGRGTLLSCDPLPFFGGPVMDMVGSAIGTDRLFNIDCPIMEYRNIYPDPQHDGQFLYTLDFFYEGDGKDYYLGKSYPRTHLVAVRECRAFLGSDYDGDGITELFILTRYSQEPYMLYEWEDGVVVSLFVDSVPADVAAALHANAIS